MSKQTSAVRRDRLRDRRQLANYLQDHLRKGPEEFRLALREAVLSQAGGIAGLSRRTGLARTGLYKALSASGNPSYATIQQVLAALGMNTVIAQEVSPTMRQSTMEQTTPHVKGDDHQLGEAQGSPTLPEAQMAPKSHILPGSAKGIFVMAEDFDAPLPEFSEYM